MNVTKYTWKFGRLSILHFTSTVDTFLSKNWYLPWRKHFIQILVYLLRLRRFCLWFWRSWWRTIQPVVRCQNLMFNRMVCISKLMPNLNSRHKEKRNEWKLFQDPSFNATIVFTLFHKKKIQFIQINFNFRKYPLNASNF